MIKPFLGRGKSPRPCNTKSNMRGAIKMGKIHYIAMAGLHGYMPQYCASFPCHKDASDSLVQLHELDRNHELDLIRDSYTELNLKDHGNEYAEIIECDCDSPNDHND